jgi:DNA-binding CsgD family transcriptional regulator
MPDVSELSERELDILRLIATGASNKEIAHQLYISPNTVKVHLKNIFSKIGVASRTEAAMAAVQSGLVPALTTGVMPGSETIGAESASRESPDGEAVPSAKPFEEVRPAPARRVYMVAGILLFLILLGTVGLLLASGRFPPAGALASPSPAIELPRWSERAGLPTARSGLSVAAFENRVYAIGGESAQGVTGKLERYDPETDRWEELASKTTPVTEAGAAVIGGLIYVPGGQLASGEPTDLLEVYDPFRNRWERRASLPVAVSAYALTAFEGRLYLFGGWDGTRPRNEVYEYDPALDAWRERTSMPTARAYAAATEAGGRIYVIGGFDGERALEVNEAYQPARDHEGGGPWFHMKSMPVARYAMGVASLADVIHIVGGAGDEGSPLLPLKYFPQVNEWQVLEGENEDVLNDWSHLRLAPIETSIYALGGLRNEQPTGQNMAYQAIYTLVIPIVR